MDQDRGVAAAAPGNNTLAPSANKSASLPPALAEVLFLPLSEMARRPIGLLDLLCATGLPDTPDLDIRACLLTLEQWAEQVKRQTDRLVHRFRAKPHEYGNCEAYFRVLVMITVLQRDLGVRYDPAAIHRRTYKSSREGFLHGLVTGDKTGTCANMPVLYAHIGRRLGYPIYLCQAKGHLFCRWRSPDGKERFNIEASGKGLSVFPDDHYKTWPRPISEQEVHHGVFLRSLDPVEELGMFMSIRGEYLRDMGCVVDAIVAFAHAHRLAPTDPHHMAFLMAAINTEIDLRNSGKLPCTYRASEVYQITNGLPLERFTLNDNFVRMSDVPHNGSRPGRMIPADDQQ